MNPPTVDLRQTLVDTIEAYKARRLNPPPLIPPVLHAADWQIEAMRAELSREIGRVATADDLDEWVSYLLGTPVVIRKWDRL